MQRFYEVFLHGVVLRAQRARYVPPRAALGPYGLGSLNMNAVDNNTSTQKQEISPEDLAAAKSEYRLLKRLMIAALWVSCALALSLNLADPDLWGHVTYGQDALRDATLHTTATHTFTAVDYPWINHENLAELTFALGYKWLGDEGLLVGKCLLGLAILAAMAWIAHRHGVRHLTVAAFLLLVANNLTAFFPVRPQLLSFAWFTLLLIVFEQAFRGWRGWLTDTCAVDDLSERKPWNLRQLTWVLLAVPIIALWTNSHGAFVAGVAISIAYLGGRACEALYYKRLAAAPAAAAMVALALITAAATLLNPYGTALHGWLLASLGSPRPEITEWAAPSTTDPVFWPFVTIIVVCITSLSFTRLRRDWVQIAILALVCWQACSHLRHIAFFTLLCGFWLPPHIQSMFRRMRPSMTANLPVQRLGAWPRWIAATSIAIAIGLQSLALYGRLERLPVYRSMYPVDAAQWMTFKGIDGRLIVSFNWAQYAIAALSPDTTVAFDGRFRTCYPQEVVDMSFDFLLGEHEGRRYRRADAGPLDPTAILSYKNPELVLIDRTYDHAVEVMRDEAEKADPEWSLLYQDGIAQLWGRAGIFDDPHSQRYLPREERLITDRVHTTAFPWPALPFEVSSTTFAERQEAPRPSTEDL